LLSLKQLRTEIAIAITPTMINFLAATIVIHNALQNPSFTAAAAVAAASAANPYSAILSNFGLKSAYHPAHAAWPTQRDLALLKF